MHLPSEKNVTLSHSVVKAEIFESPSPACGGRAESCRLGEIGAPYSVDKLLSIVGEGRKPRVDNGAVGCED